MSVKLKGETSLVIDATDLAAILTEHLCGSRYDAFGDLRVEFITENKQNGDFTLTLAPRPKPDLEEAA